MANIDLIMPKMGESIIEATILKWLKKVGDTVEVDETILEIATDKVDSEIPSPVSGTIVEILYPENEVVAVGKSIAIIATEGEETSNNTPAPAVEKTPSPSTSSNGNGTHQPAIEKVAIAPAPALAVASKSSGDRFYSPLVRNIAAKENISQPELDQIPGTGSKGRVTKKDLMAYLSGGRTAAATTTTTMAPPASTTAPNTAAASTGGNVEIIEMDRMRKLIADHMVMSKHTSPHVTSFIEADVTNMVNWRNRVKGSFQEKYGEKITFTPMIIEAVVKALRDFPMVNVSVEGSKIIVKKDLNVGMAAALPSGNLIVPVIKNADHLNLVGITKAVNDLATRARNNQLKPQEIQGGTFTLTNVGTFGNVMGTPIINQPQVAIMAAGAIRKKPAVLETEYGDVIAIRQLMFLSLSYDHRVVDGFLGGSFLRRVGDYLEQFDDKQTI